jgi:AbrB family looped-hinge helix DNA binding protein
MENRMYKVRVNSNGQITLPREIRRKLNIKAGDKMFVIIDGKQMVLKPFKMTLLDLRGSVKVESKQDFDVIRRRVLSAIE